MKRDMVYTGITNIAITLHCDLRDSSYFLHNFQNDQNLSILSQKLYIHVFAHLTHKIKIIQ